jgi:peptidoglycan/LPS O-acetylase OafA/YrhL
MLSLIAFLLLPLVAFGVRRRRGVRALIVVMVIVGAVVDSDAQWHFLTALGTAHYDSTTTWAETVATTLAYIWFPDSRGLRAVQFVATVMLGLLLAWTLGGMT